MKRYLIERNIPGAGDFTADDLQKISMKSNEVLSALAPRVQWVQSFVTDDRIVCHYLAEDAETVLEHAREGGFPADRISEVRHVIDPMTAGDPA